LAGQKEAGGRSAKRNNPAGGKRVPSRSGKGGKKNERGFLEKEGRSLLREKKEGNHLSKKRKREGMKAGKKKGENLTYLKGREGSLHAREKKGGKRVADDPKNPAV